MAWPRLSDAGRVLHTLKCTKSGLEIKASASIGLVTVVEKVCDVTRIGAMHLK
jgi:hypothetical protein